VEIKFKDRLTRLLLPLMLNCLAFAVALTAYNAGSARHRYRMVQSWLEAAKAHSERTIPQQLGFMASFVEDAADHIRFLAICLFGLLAAFTLAYLLVGRESLRTRIGTLGVVVLVLSLAIIFRPSH
jgi:hypothetical protein